MVSDAGPILVVGAGPTGLTMACELARHGAPVRIVDKRAEIDPHCPATGVHLAHARDLPRPRHRGRAHGGGPTVSRVQRVRQRPAPAAKPQRPRGLTVPVHALPRAVPDRSDPRRVVRSSGRHGGAADRAAGARGGMRTVSAPRSVTPTDARRPSTRPGSSDAMARTAPCAISPIRPFRAGRPAPVCARRCDRRGRDRQLTRPTAFLHDTGVLYLFPLPRGRCLVVASLSEHHDQTKEDSDSRDAPGAARGARARRDAPASATLIGCPISGSTID